MRITHTRKGKAKRTRKAAEPSKPAVSFTRASRLSEVTDEIWPAQQLEADYPEITDPAKRTFLAALTVMPRIGRACKLAGITPKTAWNWRTNPDDPLFLEAFQRAQQIGAERIVSEIVRRGVEGYEKPVWHNGQLAGTERVYSDQLLVAAGKVLMPERFAEQRRIAAPGGGPIQAQVEHVAYGDLKDEEIAQRAGRLQALLAGSVGPDLPGEVAPSSPAQEDQLEAAYARRLAERGGNHGTGSNGNG